MTLFATVEHSGTRKTIEVMRWKLRPIEEEDQVVYGEVLFTHLWTRSMDAVLSAAKRMWVVTTFRPVEHIRASWERQGKSLDELDQQLRNYERLLQEVKPYVINLGGGRATLRPSP